MVEVVRLKLARWNIEGEMEVLSTVGGCVRVVST